MSEELVRTFVAVELPSEVKAEFGKIETELGRRAASVLGADAAGKAIKWVDPEGVHLTLKFLGSVAGSRIPSIEDAMRRAAAGKTELTIELGGLGTFPSLTRPRVIWISAHGELVKLASLQADVESELASLGYERENRAFNAHITLGRLRETAGSDERKKIGEVVKAGVKMPPMVVRIDAISLMRSQLSRSGARYTRIAHVQLQPTN